MTYQPPLFRRQWKGRPCAKREQRDLKQRLRQILILIAISLLAGIAGCADSRPAGSPRDEEGFSFIVTADIVGFVEPGYESPQYFLGACAAIRDVGQGAFMVSVGDVNPPQHVYRTIRNVFGDDYPWYPVVGNHDAEDPDYMAWLRDWGRHDIPRPLRRGPVNGEETTYSFDVGSAHFVVINQYYNGRSDAAPDGDVVELLFNWLKNDLEANRKPFVFVFGHEPLVSIPDADNGRHRHVGDSLDAYPENSHRFQQLLRRHRATAYICGHTHGFSYAKINGIWQLDAGHAGGIGDVGACSTFLKIHVGGRGCRAEAYRADANGRNYTLAYTVVLD